MYHYFYLTERNPALDTGAFIDRWRRHAVIAAAIPEFWSPIRRYLQNDVLPDGLPGVDGVTTGYDALGEFFFDEAEDKVDAPPHLANDMTEIAGPGGRRYFGGEREVLSGTPEGPWRVTRIGAATEGTSVAALAAALREGALNLDDIGISIGVAVSRSTRPDFPFDGVVTVWVSDVEAAAKLVASRAWHALGERTAGLSDPGQELTLVSREVLLKVGPGGG